jgi:hypothetical protein
MTTTTLKRHAGSNVDHAYVEFRDRQKELFSITLFDIKEHGNGRLTGTGHDRLTYQLKNQSRGRFVPLNEWLCYEIAEAVGIPVPVKKIVEVPARGLMFGSRHLATHTHGGGIRLPDADFRALGSGTPLWRILALDWFLGNWDRHYANLVFYECAGARCVQAVDYEKGLLSYEQMRLSDPAKAKHDTSTSQTARTLNGVWPWQASMPDIFDVLDRLGNVTAAHVEAWIQSAPQEWAPRDIVEPCVHWWLSSAPTARVERIKAALQHGEFV